MPEKNALPDIRIITITLHPDNDYEPELDLDTDVDPWSAVTILRAVADDLYDELRGLRDDPEDD